MKALKIIGIIVLILAAVILIPPLFINGSYSVEKEVTINQPKSDVFNYIKLLRNQDNFSVWANMDPDMKKEFTGTDGTVGFISAWDSKDKNVGKGEQEIMGITDGERIDFELRFLEPFEATDKAYMITEAVNDSVTLVKWGFDGKMNYPMNFMMLFWNMEEMLGPDLQKGLNKLKENLDAV
jgi:hypothetical protein